MRIDHEGRAVDGVRGGFGSHLRGSPGSGGRRLSIGQGNAGNGKQGNSNGSSHRLGVSIDASLSAHFSRLCRRRWGTPLIIEGYLGALGLKPPALRGAGADSLLRVAGESPVQFSCVAPPCFLNPSAFTYSSFTRSLENCTFFKRSSRMSCASS